MRREARNKEARAAALGCWYQTLRRGARFEPLRISKSVSVCTRAILGASSRDNLGYSTDQSPACVTLWAPAPTIKTGIVNRSDDEARAAASAAESRKLVVHRQIALTAISIG